MAIRFAVSNWSGWTLPGADGQQVQDNSIAVSQSPDVSAIPALLRRRLNPMGRICVSEIAAPFAGG